MRNSIIMGADFYDADMARAKRRAACRRSGIGRNCIIDHAIIDKNARIGDGVVITPEGKPENYRRARITTSATASWWCRKMR